MIVRMFKEQFAEKVKNGDKCQTCRPFPARLPLEGMKISLRKWSGKPYRSKQVVLRESRVTRVATFEIKKTGIIVAGYAEPMDDFARADGFADFFEMRDWFQAQHGLPFYGIVIYWQKLKGSE